MLSLAAIPASQRALHSAPLYTSRSVLGRAILTPAVCAVARGIQAPPPGSQAPATPGGGSSSQAASQAGRGRAKAKGASSSAVKAPPTARLAVDVIHLILSLFTHKCERYGNQAVDSVHLLADLDGRVATFRYVLEV